MAFNLRNISGVFTFRARTLHMEHTPARPQQEPRESLLARVRTQFMLGFGNKKVTVVRPDNFEIQILPKPRASLRNPARISPAQKQPLNSARCWFASRIVREKLAQTSSNLG